MKFKRIILVATMLFAAVLPAQTNTAIRYEDVSAKKKVIIEKRMSKDKESLIEPTRICADSKGNLFLLESKEKYVKKYSGDGKFITKFGREGNGPGEMQACSLMKTDNADNILLYDEVRKKLIKYSNSGKFLNELSIPLPLNDFHATSEGTIYMETIKEGTAADENGKLVILSVYSQNLKKQRKIDSCLVKDYKQLTNPRVGIELPYAARILWGVSKNAVYVAFTGQYKIVMYTKEGKYIKYFNGRAAQVRVTEKDKESYFNRLNYNQGNKTVRLNEVPLWLKKGMEFPFYKPLICDLLIDPDKNILCKTFTIIDNKNVWDVYKADGTFIKKILVPSAVREQEALLRNGYLYVILESADGLFSVEKYPVGN